MDLPWSWFIDDWSGWSDWSNWSGCWWADNLEASAPVPQVPPVPKRHREVPKKTNLKETSVAWWYLVAQKIVRFNLCWEIAGMLCGQWEMNCALGSIDLSSWSICLTGQTGFRRFTQTSDKKIKKWNQQSHGALVSKKALAVMLRPASIAAGCPAESCRNGNTMKHTQFRMFRVQSPRTQNVQPVQRR